MAVTGASGFLGRHFVAAAEARGYQPRRLGRGGEDRGARFDLADRQLPDPALLKGVDILVHLAAYIPPDQKDPAEAVRCFETNALGTLRLAQAAAAAGVRHFVHTVSANAYAPGLAHPDEAAPLMPTGRGCFYLTSKLAQEIFATQVGHANGMDVASLRLSSVYGIDQNTGPIPNIARDIAAGRAVRLADGGRYGTDWIDVADVIAALFLVIENRRTGPLNIGSGARTTMAELVELIAGKLGVEPAIEYVPSGGSDDLGFPALAIDAARTLGLEPATLSARLDRLLPLLTGADAPSKSAFTAPLAPDLQQDRSA